MSHNLITLDFYNSTFTIVADGKSYHWNNASDFVTTTMYPYADTTRLLSYEPDRDLYIIEHNDNTVTVGKDQPEFIWIEENFTRLGDIAANLELAYTPIITLDMLRTSKLAESDWVLLRYQEETMLGISHTLTAEQLNAVLQYRQALRDLTLTIDKDTPASEVTWPVAPYPITPA